jgi:hypothetical protein
MMYWAYEMTELVSRDPGEKVNVQTLARHYYKQYHSFVRDVGTSHDTGLPVPW